MLDPADEDAGFEELSSSTKTLSGSSRCEDLDGKVYEDVLKTVRDQSDKTSFLLKIMNLTIMFYPLLASIYSKVIWDCRTFTYPRDRQ
jgi:hypothetical protein